MSCVALVEGSPTSQEVQALMTEDTAQGLVRMSFCAAWTTGVAEALHRRVDLA